MTPNSPVPQSAQNSPNSPAHVRTLFQRAIGLHQQGNLALAQRAYAEVLQADPRHADALHLLGVIAAQSNDPAAAVELIERAIAIDPLNFAAYGNLGSALHGLRRLREALAAYDQAIAIKGDYADAHFNRGNVLRDLAQLDAALTSYDAAIAVNPAFAQAHFFRGNVLYELKQPRAALASYDQAIAVKPDFAEAYSNRGNILRELDQFDAALASYDRAIAIDAKFAQAYFNRGVALNQLKQPAAALASYDQALALDGNLAEAHFNKSLVLLLSGDFANGWAEHEWRWDNKFGSNINEKRSFREPQWRGAESLAGATILLYAEQGFGDTLQLCRYARLVAERGAKVILEVPKPLERLLAGLDGVSQLVVRGNPLPPFDYQCPLMSLPLAFKTDVGSIPAPVKYLPSDPVKVAHWQERLGAKTLPRVGLMWNGNPLQPNDRNRSFWLADWIPHLPPGFQYISLQREVREDDAKTLEHNPHILSYAAELTDFSDTAALCDCMDVVISVCTSVAHLSAGLGRRTWVLLSFAADWRWLLDRHDSPWYPSARLYRQEQRGDWAAVFQRVRHALIDTFAQDSSAGA